MVLAGLCLPWAIHLADGVLDGFWLLGGFALAGLLAGLALLLDWRRQRRQGTPLTEAEVVHLAVFTAAFYVASLIHVRLGPTSVHLLLNGLLGVVLGWRAALAIPVGLLLQAALFGHGGFTTLGVNTVIMVLPALAAGGLFHGLEHLQVLERPWLRFMVMTLAGTSWMLCLIMGISLLLAPATVPLQQRWQTLAEPLVTSPGLGWAAALAFGLILAWQEPRLGPAPHFALGLVIGVVAVLLTMALASAVLLWGGEEDWPTLVVLLFVAHLPIAALEGLILGFTVSFLARVKPELLRRS